MKQRIVIYSLLFILIFLCVGACRKAGIWLVKEDEQTHADAIVILMGSISDRVMWAADLYHKDLARQIIMVNTGLFDVDESMHLPRGFEPSNTILSREELIALGVPADSIVIIPGGALSTQMEATLVRDYITKNNKFDTLIIVSSAEHLRRATMIFRTAFRYAGLKIHIISSPSKYTNFVAENWWRNREGTQKVLLEYMKISNFILFQKKKLKSIKVLSDDSST